MLAALALFYFYQKVKNKFLGLGVIVFIAIYFFFFTFNSQLMIKPVGIKNFCYASPLQELTQSYYHLDNYLEELFRTQQAIMPVKSEYPQIKAFEEKQEEKILSQIDKSFVPKENIFLFYDNRINYTHVRWIFMRRGLYERRPIFDSESLLILLSKGPYHFANLGFDAYYFVFAEPSIVKDDLYPDHHAPVLKNLLITKGYQPIKIINDSDGSLAFSIFKTNNLLFLYAIPED